MRADRALVGGVGATIVSLVATKMVADWFESSEIVLAMSLLQMSWPFGAMIALPIQTFIAQSLGWHAVMGRARSVRWRCCCAFAMIPHAAQPIAGGRRRPRPAAACGAGPGADIRRHLGRDESRLRAVLQLRAAVDGGAGIVADGFGVADVSLAIWFTILAIPAGGYLVHRSGRPITAIIACGLIAAAALMVFVADFHPTIACLIFGIAIGPMSGAILSLPARVLEPADRSVGFGLFYTCFYVLMAVGPTAAGRLQDALGSPSAALVASAALLATMVPLVALFWSVSKRGEFAQEGHEAKLRAAS